MSASLHYRTAREGRDHFKTLLDAAADGRPATVTRDQQRVAALDADRLVHFLTSVRPAGAELLAEAGGWSIFIPGVPVAADGATLDEAVDEMVVALRDYAEAWTERLRLAPNHEGNWGLVQIVSLASDEELRYWLLG